MDKTSYQSTIAQYIKRFREGSPTCREQRQPPNFQQASSKQFWWIQESTAFNLPADHVQEQQKINRIENSFVDCKGAFDHLTSLSYEDNKEEVGCNKNYNVAPSSQTVINRTVDSQKNYEEVPMVLQHIHSVDILNDKKSKVEDEIHEAETKIMFSDIEDLPQDTYEKDSLYLPSRMLEFENTEETIARLRRRLGLESATELTSKSNALEENSILSQSTPILRYDSPFHLKDQIIMPLSERTNSGLNDDTPIYQQNYYSAFPRNDVKVSRSKNVEQKMEETQTRAVQTIFCSSENLKGQSVEEQEPNSVVPVQISAIETDLKVLDGVKPDENLVVADPRSMIKQREEASGNAEQSHQKTFEPENMNVKQEKSPLGIKDGSLESKAVMVDELVRQAVGHWLQHDSSKKSEQVSQSCKQRERNPSIVASHFDSSIEPNESIHIPIEFLQDEVVQVLLNQIQSFESALQMLNRQSELIP